MDDYLKLAEKYGYKVVSLIVENMRNGKRRTKMGKGKNKPNKFSRKYM